MDYIQVTNTDKVFHCIEERPIPKLPWTLSEKIKSYIGLLMVIVGLYGFIAACVGFKGFEFEPITRFFAEGKGGGVAIALALTGAFILIAVKREHTKKEMQQLYID